MCARVETMRGLLQALAILWLVADPCARADIEKLGRIEIKGTIYEARQLSAIAGVGSLLVVGADEGTGIQVLHPVRGKDSFRAANALIPLLESDTEIDIEGLSAVGNTVHVLGSHSLKRRRISSELSRKANRKRITEVVAEPSRDHLFRFELDPESGKLASGVASISLRDILERDPILGRFTQIPGKENGVDIEGIAVAGNRIYLGFRSPVLRDGYVPVAILPFSRPESYQLRFLDLGGKGIRDMTHVGGGFLLIAGPTADNDGKFRLMFWDGGDQLPGTDRRAAELVRLGTIPVPDGPPEGIVVVEETESWWEVLIVYEGSSKGRLTRFRVDRPPVSARPRPALEPRRARSSRSSSPPPSTGR